MILPLIKGVLYTKLVSNALNKTVFVRSYRLNAISEVFYAQNFLRPELRPLLAWGSLQCSVRPYTAGGEGH